MIASTTTGVSAATVSRLPDAFQIVHCSDDRSALRIAIERGIEDYRAGRMKPWQEVKRELGL